MSPFGVVFLVADLKDSPAMRSLVSMAMRMSMMMVIIVMVVVVSLPL